MATIKFTRVIIISLTTMLTVYGTTLQSIEFNSSETEANLVLNFDKPAPDFSIESGEVKDISIAVISIPGATAQGIENFNVHRPILHIITNPSAHNPANLDVTIFLEKAVEIKSDVTGTVIKVSFKWEQVIPEDAPDLITNIVHASNEANSLNTTFQFTRIPTQKAMFLTEDKKNAILIFHNTEAKYMSIPQSSLITKFQPINGTSELGFPFTKYIIQSSQELLMDTQEEGNKIFLEFYGLGGDEPAPDAVAAVPEEEPYSHETEPFQEEDDTNKLVDMAVGGDEPAQDTVAAVPEEEPYSHETEPFQEEDDTNKLVHMAVGGDEPAQDAVAAVPEEEPYSNETEPFQEEEDTNKWVYMAVGGIALVSTGITVLYLLSSGGDKEESWPDPNIAIKMPSPDPE